MAKQVQSNTEELKKKSVPATEFQKNDKPIDYGEKHSEQQAPNGIDLNALRSALILLGVGSISVPSGSIQGNGTVNYLPSGWSCSYLGTGTYKITHNINTSNYALAVTADGGPTDVTILTAITSTYFVVQTYTSGGSANVDAAFTFILAKK